MTKTDLPKLLLEWYAACGRSLPWRVKGGAHPDPYVILVSELMLQQTTVKTVIPYFERFMKRFPTVQSLAAAELEEVYRYWEGLGYYTRARSLHATARTIAEDFGGVFPQTREEVLKLKGIGPYTASSLLALGFNLPETVIDGNVVRVICRLYRLTRPITEIMPEIRKKAAVLTSKRHPADYASAIMDLGAIVCTPKNPQCLICPWQRHCLSCGKSGIENIPLRVKPEKKEKQGIVYITDNAAGQIYIRRRTEKGLLSGLWEFPWTESAETPAGAADSGLTVTHVFTHFKLTLKIYTMPNTPPCADGQFVSPADFGNYAFSTLMKKVWQKASTAASRQSLPAGASAAIPSAPDM